MSVVGELLTGSLHHQLHERLTAKRDHLEDPAGTLEVLRDGGGVNRSRDFGDVTDGFRSASDRRRSTSSRIGGGCRGGWGCFIGLVLG